jgi:alpha-L-fucosidase
LPTIRWPGNEKGVVAYPCWSTLDRARIAATEAPNQVEADRRQIQGVENPDGDYWAPHEADVPLHDHFWHMRPAALNHRRSLETLMECYEQSVGRNSFLILNCAPMADGGVHPDDMKRYEEFGSEIQRRFGNPFGKTEQIASREAILNLGSLKNVGYVDLWEDYRYGHRIRAFVIEGFDGKGWVKLFEGTAVGRRMLARCNPIEVSQVRVRITESVGTPLIRRLQVHAPAQSR